MPEQRIPEPFLAAPIGSKAVAQDQIRGAEGLRVRVTPRARANEVAGLRSGVLLLRVTAPPEDGRANAAVCKLLARRLGIRAAEVEILSGQHSREKVLRVRGLNSEEALGRLLGGD